MMFKHVGNLHMGPCVNAYLPRDQLVQNSLVLLLLGRSRLLFHLFHLRC